ncbi:MAG: DUF952 domain-containing protein [Myxococcota bacterium]
MYVFKILRSEEWEHLAAEGRTLGAPIDIADGFVHLSKGEQVAETAAKYFSRVDGLVLLALDSDALGADLRWEPSRGGQLFPHLYRELTLEDVSWRKSLPWTDQGHIFPEVF